MKTPDMVANVAFCTVYQQIPDEVAVDIHPGPTELHDAFDKLPKDIPAYALNFGMILREQNV
jgi:hypothetical protein